VLRLRLLVLGLGAAAPGFAGCSPGIIYPADPATVGAVRDVVEWDDSPGQPSPDERGIASTPGGPALIIFVNRSGRTYTPGGNDSAEGTSSVVAGRIGTAVTVPPAPFGDQEWAQIMSCVKQDFAPFDVLVTDERPAAGPYVEVAVGGLSSLLDPSLNLLGISPFNCSVTRRSVAFVFADHPVLRESVKLTCETISHEAGHSLGLEHSQLANDPMTYKDFPGDLAFQDEDAECGGFSVEPCRCTLLQNTFRRLVANVGEAPATPRSLPPASTDTGAPQLVIVSPAAGATVSADGPLRIVVRASDPAGARDVRLFWESENRYLPCDDSVAGVRCTRSGDTLTWVLNVGFGERRFAAVAGDAAGNRVSTETRTIWLTPDRRY
jgi:hypothetical protein